METWTDNIEEDFVSIVSLLSRLRMWYLMNVAILGLGRMGELHFLNALKMKDVNIVAVADKKKDPHMIESNRVKFYNDYQKLLDCEDLDAVVISLPNYLKKESIIYSAERGVDIFVDKPLARNYD